MKFRIQADRALPSVWLPACLQADSARAWRACAALGQVCQIAVFVSSLTVDGHSLMGTRLWAHSGCQPLLPISPVQL